MACSCASARPLTSTRARANTTHHNAAATAPPVDIVPICSKSLFASGDVDGCAVVYNVDMRLMWFMALPRVMCYHSTKFVVASSPHENTDLSHPNHKLRSPRVVAFERVQKGVPSLVPHVNVTARSRVHLPSRPHSESPSRMRVPPRGPRRPAVTSAPDHTRIVLSADPEYKLPSGLTVRA